MKRKLASILLVLCISVGMLGGVSFAATIVDSGTCGNDLTWTLDSEGTLTISGNGEMRDYDYYEAPWYNKNNLIRNVVIGNGVTTIGEHAFWGCSSLKSSTVQGRVTTINEGAFSGCYSLRQITLPDSIVSIKNSAFYICNALSDIYFDGTLEAWNKISIGYYNANLTSARLHCNIEVNYDANGGKGAPETQRKSEYVNIVLSSIVPTRAGYAFKGWSTTSSGMVEYEPGDIYTANTSVTLYAVWEKIFSGTCGEDLTWMLDDAGTLTISGEGAMTDYTSSSSAPWYSSRRSIKTVVIESGVTTIGDRAFYFCNKLTSITIPNSVTKIGDSAFYYCWSLTSVTIPDNVTTIGDGAFYYCDSLIHVTIGNSVTTIGDRAFYSCESLTSVTIPDSVTAIGDWAFCSCESLTSVTIPDSVTAIGDDAFYGCTGLTNITIGNSVTTIGYGAFSSCNSLENVYFVGTKEDWKEILIGYNNDDLTSAKIHYFVNDIKIEMPINGTISTDKSSALEGEIISITTVPDSGYVLQSVLVNGIAIEGNTFTMSAEDVTVTAVFVPVDYAVTVLAAKNGQITVDQEKANYGEEITVTVAPNPGYVLQSVLVNGIAIEENTFAMPAENVTVTAVFVLKVYTIITEQVENGNITTDKQTATFDEIVTVTTHPLPGYALEKILVNGVAIEGDSFLMPKCDVTVSAEFVLCQVKVTTIDGAQIRTLGKQGIRFISSIDKTTADFSHVVEYGTILIPSADITDISQLQINAILNGHNVVKVKAKNIYSETNSTITFTAVITDVKEKNYGREYTARGYAILDNGGVVYADNGGKRSIYTVAKKALGNSNESQSNLALFQKIVSITEPHLYKAEYQELTDTYNTAIAELQEELSRLNSALSAANVALDQAEQKLERLPTMRSSYVAERMQQYMGYGSYEARKIAESEWASYYSAQSARYNGIIATQENLIQQYNNNISQNQSEQNRLTLKYSTDISWLKEKYKGISNETPDTSEPDQYETEYQVLTDAYNTAIAELQEELSRLNSHLSVANIVLNEAEQGLADLPSRKNVYISQRVNDYINEGSFHNSYHAQVQATTDWEEHYSTESARYNGIIATQKNLIQQYNNSISQNQSEQNRLTLKYFSDVSSLKEKYNK